tara:strand:+ start:44 stop:2251 length:2208 start_codon:yes stop_codon:yes gene_type:complete
MSPEEIEANFPDTVCSLTHSLMINPVVTNNGISFEKEAILNWLRTNEVCPITREYLDHSLIKPNIALKNLIDTLLNKKQQQSKKPALNITKMTELTSITPTLGIIDDNYSLNIQTGKNKNTAKLHLTLVIDISGSMGSLVEMKNADGEKSTYNLCYLDLVKHFIKTIIHSLNECSLTVVSFNNRANVVFSNKVINGENKEFLMEKVDVLRPNGTTDLWSGITVGINETYTVSEDYLKQMILLTDGIPTYEPPMGISKSIVKLIKTKGVEFPIHTIGFGYNLQVNILRDVSYYGNSGKFYYIPETSMLGTTLIHLLSNLLIKCTKSTVVELEIENDIVNTEFMKYTQSYKYEIDGNKVVINIGQLNSNSARTLLFPKEHNVVRTTIKYIDLNNVLNSYEISNIEDIRITPEYITQKFRNVFIYIISLIYDKIVKQDKTEEIINLLDNFEKDIRVSGYDSHKYMIDILEDFNTQIKPALLNYDYFKKWGKYYLVSFMNTHLYEECNNFKDKSIQHYKTEEFEEICDIVDTIFCDLPPPKPTAKSGSMYGGGGNYRGSTNTAPINMRTFSDASNGCFHGSCVVKTPYGSKLVSDIKKNDRVCNSDNSVSVIECVIKIKTSGNLASLVNMNGLLITPWHPIYINDKWKFPVDIGKTDIYECDYVYNFIVNNRKSMIINNTVCCTLGHNIQGDVIGHEYFGSDRVISDLKLHNVEYDNGLIDTISTFKRDITTGLVTMIY